MPYQSGTEGAIRSAPLAPSSADGVGIDKLVSDKPSTPDSPPDGGTVAWLQVLGSFILFFNSWGLINSYGVFQSYYGESLLPNYSASAISWIGTVQGWLIFQGALVVGPIFDRGYLKSLICAGTLFVAVGLMMTSLSTQYYQVFLAHGVAVGIGCACLFLPSIAIIPTYFTTRRAVATGIAASGGSIGSVIYPIIFHKLIGLIGFGWTTRVIAFIALLTLTTAWIMMRVRVPPPKHPRPLLELPALKDTSFVIFSLSIFLTFMGLYFPFFFLQVYFIKRLESSAELAFYIIAILNATSVFGRIAPGLVADRFGSLNTIIPVGFVTAVLAFAWIGITNVPGTIVFTCLYGFASGATVSLPPTVLAKLTPDMSLFGTRLGMAWTLTGIGLLVGNPIAGALLDIEHAVFWKGQLFSAIFLTAGAAHFAWLRYTRFRLGDPWRV